MIKTWFGFLKMKLMKTLLYEAYSKKRYPDEYKKINAQFRDIKNIRNELEKRKCKLIIVLPPNEERMKKLSKEERFRIKNWVFDFNHITPREVSKISQLYDNCSLDYIKQVYDGAKIIKKDGHKTVADYASKYVNYSNGIRKTVGQPEEFISKIHIYGACTVRGTGVEDSHTIASFMQKQLNSEHRKIQCVNHGIGCGSEIEDDLYAIENTVLYENDIVILCHQCSILLEEKCKKENMYILDTSKYFDERYDNTPWFIDTTLHTNRYGNQIIAQAIVQYLNKNIGFKEQVTLGERTLAGCINADTKINREWISSVDFQKYLALLNKNKLKTKGKSGAIVMNCNPFTLGHRYLIETAANMVDVLYIFVVEEDKSFFKFNDRFQLVKNGTQDLSNVVVLPSGKFIISSVTFPGYFYKDHNKEAVVDTSQDVDLFGKYIAPVLDIKIRFAGEEPLDPITNQYNKMMEERLPVFGLEFKIIARKKEGCEVISASRVRQLMSDGKWDEIRKLVPDVTWHYLQEEYGDKG